MDHKPEIKIEEMDISYHIFASQISIDRFPQLFCAQQKFNWIPFEILENSPPEELVDMMVKSFGVTDRQKYVDDSIPKQLRSANYAFSDPEKQFQLDIAYEVWKIDQLFKQGKTKNAMNMLYRLGAYDELYQTMVYPFFQAMNDSFPQVCRKEKRFLLPNDISNLMLQYTLFHIGERSSRLGIAYLNDEQSYDFMAFDTGTVEISSEKSLNTVISESLVDMSGIDEDIIDKLEDYAYQEIFAEGPKGLAHVNLDDAHIMMMEFAPSSEEKIMYSAIARIFQERVGDGSQVIVTDNPVVKYYFLTNHIVNSVGGRMYNNGFKFDLQLHQKRDELIEKRRVEKALRNLWN